MIRDKYENYRAALLVGGASEADADDAVRGMEMMDKKIDARVCPTCRSKITRILDPRQDGPTEVAGKWFKYRCLSCKWFADRCEPVGEN